MAGVYQRKGKNGKRRKTWTAWWVNEDGRKVEKVEGRDKAAAEGVESISSVGPMRAFGWRDYSGGMGFFSPDGGTFRTPRGRLLKTGIWRWLDLWWWADPDETDIAKRCPYGECVRVDRMPQTPWGSDLLTWVWVLKPLGAGGER